MRTHKGQGLIEMLIALSVLTVGVVGSINLATSNSMLTNESETRVVAANLAREALEVVRALRDTNRLQALPAPMSTGLEQGTDYTAIPVFVVGSATWSLDFGPNAMTEQATRVVREGVVYRQANPLPSGAGIAPTAFRRLVTLNPICSNGTISSAPCASAGNPKVGIQVLAQVSIDAKGGRTLTTLVEDRLYQW